MKSEKIKSFRASSMEKLSCEQREQYKQSFSEQCFINQEINEIKNDNCTIKTKIQESISEQGSVQLFKNVMTLSEVNKQNQQQYNSMCASSCLDQRCYQRFDLQKEYNFGQQSQVRNNYSNQNNYQYQQYDEDIYYRNPDLTQLTLSNLFQYYPDFKQETPQTARQCRNVHNSIMYGNDFLKKYNSINWKQEEMKDWYLVIDQLQQIEFFYNQYAPQIRWYLINKNDQVVTTFLKSTILTLKCPQELVLMLDNKDIKISFLFSCWLNEYRFLDLTNRGSIQLEQLDLRKVLIERESKTGNYEAKSLAIVDYSEQVIVKQMLLESTQIQNMQVLQVVNPLTREEEVQAIADKIIQQYVANQRIPEFLQCNVQDVHKLVDFRDYQQSIVFEYVLETDIMSNLGRCKKKQEMLCNDVQNLFGKMSLQYLLSKLNSFRQCEIQFEQLDKQISPIDFLRRCVVEGMKKQILVELSFQPTCGLDIAFVYDVILYSTELMQQLNQKDYQQLINYLYQITIEIFQ